ncbi:hypothetical protein CRV24_007646 [Beauveria bassiana]|nr:hypothetical protein CRV24_007646 [Beauveria bassiana]KAH8715682.1 hypothetical protein HC256_004480 [Beauveria bassiana]
MLGVGALECGGSEPLEDTILAREGGIRGYACEAHPREAFDKQAADFYITSCDEGDAYLATKARILERARTDFLIIVSNI